MTYLPDREMEKALVYFEMNTRSYPRSPGAWASLGEAYAEAGAPKKAKRAFRKALALSPAHARAQRGLAALEGE